MSWIRHYTPKKEYLYFANTLKDKLQAEKMSQNDLGDLVGVSQQVVSEWITGDEIPSKHRLQKICDIFKWDLNTIVLGIIAEISDSDIQERIIKRYS